MSEQNQNPATTTTTTPPAPTPNQTRALAIRDGIGGGSSPMAIVPTNFGEAYQLANALANSKIIPSDLRERAPDVLMMILSGAEMGLAPMASLRAFDVIKGVATLKTRTLVAAASMHRDVEYLEPVEYSAEIAVWAGKKRGRPEMRVTFTKADAERAGLWNNGDNWRKYPADMLAARASKRLANMLCPEIGLGIRTSEEVRDGGFDDVIDADFVAVPPTPPPPPVAPIVPTSIDVTAPKKAKNANPPAEGKPASAERNKAAADEAIAKAAENAKALEVERVAKADAQRKAADEEAKMRAEAEADAASVEALRAATAATPATTPAPSSTDDDFGGGEEVESSGIVAEVARTFANFERDLAKCKTQEDLDRVKIYVPWSRVGAPGEQYGARMKEAFGKKKSEIVK